MKELKVKFKGLHLVEKRSHKQCLSLPLVKPMESVTAAIETLQPQLTQRSADRQRSGCCFEQAQRSADQAQKQLPQPIKKGRERLAVQAQRINQLSVELEAAILELKAIANDLKREQRSNQSQEPIKSMCEYSAALVPCVRYKKSGVFVLTTRQVDLFQAEREATQVAQTLRRRAKKSRTVLSLPAQSNKQSK